MQDLDARIVDSRQRPPRPAGVVVAVTHFDLRMSPVDQFWWQRFPQAVERHTLPHQLTLVEWALVAFIPRRRQEVCALHPAGLNSVGQRREGGLERSIAGPPEFVRVAVDDPVGALLGCQPGHACHPDRLVVGVVRLLDELQPALAFEAAQDRQAAVHRAVVRGDDPVHPLAEVESNHALQDVCFITAEQRQHQFHGRGLQRRVGLS